MTHEELLDRLPDPDEIGQSEYRVVHELLVDALAGYDSGMTMTEAEFLDGVLDEVVR